VKKSKPPQKRRSPDAQSGPSVLNIIQALEEPRAIVLEGVRDFALSLGSVEERVLYDGFCRDWTPAYYTGGRQLFHVHNFRAGLRATVFLGARTREPIGRNLALLSPVLRGLLTDDPGHRPPREVKVPLSSMEDVVALAELVRLKWEIEQPV